MSTPHPPPAQNPMQPTYPQQSGTPAGGPGQPALTKKSKKHLIGYPVVALLSIGIGAASGSGDRTATTAAGGATTTVTATATTAPEKEAPTTTVTATTTDTETVTARPSGASSTFPGDGIYEVGRDIKPGTYSSVKPDSGNCYWARLSSTDGFDGILANSNTAGQSLVTIKGSDKFFETNGCSDWVRR